MDNHAVVSREEWVAGRVELLKKEKHLTRLRDELSPERRALPWVKVEKPYVFEGANGKETLSTRIRVSLAAMRGCSARISIST
jgi:predicted dithiol-disulfide oxidoreductase (DUF899 family)